MTQIKRLISESQPGNLKTINILRLLHALLGFASSSLKFSSEKIKTLARSNARTRQAITRCPAPGVEVVKQVDQLMRILTSNSFA